MSCQRYCTAVLDRNSEDLRFATEVHCHLVTECRGEDGRRRATVHLGCLLRRVDLGLLVDICTDCQKMVIRILDVIDKAPCFAVEPDITDHAVCRRHRPRCKRDMTDDGLRVRMLIVGVGVVDPFIHQVTKTAFTQHIAVTSRQITTQGVHSDLQNQTRLMILRKDRRNQCLTGKKNRCQTDAACNRREVSFRQLENISHHSSS